MSDAKPKRVARDAMRGETPPREAVPAETAPPVIPEPAAPAEPSATPPAALPAVEAAPSAASAPVGPAAAAADDAWAALTEAQAALTRGFERIAAEMTGITRRGVAASADAAIALLGARTLAEAVEINAGLARRGFDALLEGAARLSEIGVEVVVEASRPILSRFATVQHATHG